jgi:hypothetical protein
MAFLYANEKIEKERTGARKKEKRELVACMCAQSLHFSSYFLTFWYYFSADSIYSDNIQF